MTKLNFIKKLEPGDQVIVKGTHGTGIDHVERITKTQIILKTGSRFRKNDGTQLGSSVWNFSSLNEANDEAVKKILSENEHRKLVYKLSKHSWEDMTLDELRRIYAILNK